ncbi:MAG TPA: LON peptidase substrate-binding domain-containing protein, partial [Pyrinomonadaceae bacterium]
DPLDKVSGIKHLPLFPLPLVLLPNEFLPLHIFEDRYKQMIKDAMEDRKLFGITYFEPQDELSTRPLVGTIGCVAEVRENQTLPDGRANLLTTGVVRYRLIDYVETGDPYFVGDVIFFEDEDETDEDLQSLADEVYALFERVAKAAFKLSGGRGRFPEIPKTEPEQLSFLVTAAFNLDNPLKYQMLETTSTSDRLEKLRDILNQAVNKMEDSAEIHKIAQTNGHSSKKIDL